MIACGAPDVLPLTTIAKERERPRRAQCYPSKILSLHSLQCRPKEASLSNGDVLRPQLSLNQQETIHEENTEAKTSSLFNTIIMIILCILLRSYYDPCADYAKNVMHMMPTVMFI